VPKNGLAQEHRSPQVDVVHCLEVNRLDVHERGNAVDPRIADQNVDRLADHGCRKVQSLLDRGKVRSEALTRKPTSDSSLLVNINTSHPASPRARAMASPKPLFPPVTKARRVLFARLTRRGP